MSVEKVQLSVTRLTAGDRFMFWNTQNGPAKNSPIVDIRVVAASPTLQEALSTDDVPVNNRAEIARERLATAIGESEWVSTVDIEDNLISVTFQDGFDLFVDSANAFGYENNNVTPPILNGISFIKVIDSGGQIIDKDFGDGIIDTNFGDVLLDNIRIDSVNQQLLSFSNYPTRENVAANFGDFFQTRINFTSAEPLSSTDSVKFYFGYIEKDENPYSNVDDFKIDPNKFKDPYQDSVTQFTRDVPSVVTQYELMNHTSPKWGQYGEAEIYDYGVDNQYQIRFSHYIPFLPREDDYDLLNYTIPEDVNGGKSLKPIFQIDLISDKAANAPEQSTNRVDLTNFFDKGSIGFYDQVFQTGEKFYSLTEGSLVFNNGSSDVDKIDSSRDTTVSFTIEMDDGTTPFTSTDEIILHIQDVNLVTTEAGKRKTFLDNQNFDSVLVSTNNTPINGTRITQFKAEIDAVDLWKINCEAVIPKLQVTDFYNLWCSVSRDFTATTPLMTAQNIYLQSEVAEAGGDESVIYMDLYDTTAIRTDFNFYSHWQTNEAELSGAFNEVKAFPEDHYACRFRVVNDDAAKTILTSFKVRLKGRESGVIYDGDFNFDVINGSVIPRGYNLEQQFQNEVTFTPNYGFELGKDEYFVNYAFQIDPAWSDIDDIVLEWVATYDQTLDDGTEVSFSTYRQSPDFILGTYDQTENTDLEPNTLNNAGVVEFYDYAGGVQGDKVSKVIEEIGAKTLVKYTFTDENLDDLQAIPPTPLDYTFLIANKTEGNLTGYLDLVPQGGGVSERWRFHNFEENVPSFWESVTGHPDQGYAKIQRTDIKTATIEAVIDGTKFINEFNKIPTCYNFSARMDKVQTSPAGLDVDTDIYVIIDTSSFIGVEAAAVAEARVNNWFLSYVLQTRQTNSPFVGNLYKIYPQMGAFRANYACERWLGYINCCVNNREEVDLSNPIPGMPPAYSATDTRYLAYAPGLVTCMRALDINANTVVKEESDNIINSGVLNVYYSSFFDEVGGNLTHVEKILDFFTASAEQIIFSGVSNRLTVNSSTDNNVLRYDLNGLNTNYDIDLLNFKGYYNEGNSTDITQEYDNTPLPQTITPSGKCLFIPFIEDIIGNSLNTNGYSFYDPTTIGDIRMLERPAFNTAGTDTFNEQLPTFIFQKDYEAYKNITTQTAIKYGSIVYPPQAIDRTPSDNITIGGIGALHLHILRALKGSNITLAEMKESTFLEYYDINGVGGLQNYPSLTSLDTAASGKLFSNTDAVGFNNLENDGITAIYDFGPFLSTQPAWSNAATYNTGDKVSQGGLEYTSLIDNNIGNTPSAGSSQWDITGGKGLLAGIDQNTFNSQITNGINSL